jgi:hypothetical protein
MRTLRILLASVVFSAALIPIIAAPVGATCANEQVVLYENNGNDPQGLGDALVRCVNEANLDQVPHLQAGLCNSQFFRLNDNWNDCVSSFRVTLLANRCARFYENAGGGGAVLRTVAGPSSGQLLFNFGSAQNDRLTSLRFFTKINGICQPG